MKHIIDIGWRKNDHGHFYYVMDLFDEDTQQEESIKLFRQAISFRLSAIRYCIGNHIKGVYEPCENHVVLPKESLSNCFKCEQKLGFKSAFIFGQEPNELMMEHLEREHVIYLAYFASGAIKVGTAVDSRKQIRLLEQDALAGMFIAHKSGFEISKLEHAISKELRYPEQVRSEVKRKSLHLHIDVEEAKGRLQSAYQKIVAHFKDSEFKDWFFTNPEFVDLTNVDQVYYPTEDANYVKGDESLNLVGTCIGLRGKFLITKYQDQELLYSINSIIGRKIETDKFPISNFQFTKEKKNQLSFNL